jgi:hypothetical protein
MRTIKITRNPFLLFLPFLLFYIGFILLLYSNILWGDEIRHFAYARNLLHGFYSPPAPDISLEIGPGYPLLILPFIGLHIPLICLKLMNAVFSYLSIILLFKALKRIVSFRVALIFSLFWACYYNFLELMALVYAESFTIFLVSLVVFLLLKAFSKNDVTKTKKYSYLAGFTIGYLALTKIIFGYVIPLMLIGSALLSLTNRKAANYRRSAFIFLIALITTLPYLIYTQHITGKIFYWGTSGGNNLYWMSTPYEGEYGNWNPSLKSGSDSAILMSDSNDMQNGGSLNMKNRNNGIPGSQDSLKSHHQKDFDEINKYKGIERDNAYRRIVINNIKLHPAKYIENCISNVGRILFNYPYSYSFQKPTNLLRLPLNGIISVLMLFCLIPTFINWRRIIFPIRLLLFVALLYLGGSVLASAETRMFTGIVPILLFWIAYVIQKSIKINMSPWKD